MRHGDGETLAALVHQGKERTIKKIFLYPILSSANVLYIATRLRAALQLPKGPNMSSFPTIAPAFLEEMVAYLLHLFIRGAGGDEAAARSRRPQHPRRVRR